MESNSLPYLKGFDRWRTNIPPAVWFAAALVPMLASQIVRLHQHQAAAFTRRREGAPLPVKNGVRSRGAATRSISTRRNHVGVNPAARNRGFPDPVAAIARHHDRVA
jgi:hypothetical protein